MPMPPKPSTPTRNARTLALRRLTLPSTPDPFPEDEEPTRPGNIPQLPTPTAAAQSPDTRATFNILQLLLALPPWARLPGLALILAALLAAGYLWLTRP